MKTRREFLKRSALACAWCAAVGARPAAADEEDGATGESQWMEARHYEKAGEAQVNCRLCPRECRVADRERGTCGVRENRSGTYYALNYGKVCAEHVDPIEKKPVFHFLPGSRAYSIATAGCNMECRFCQNWEISQFRPEQVPFVRRAPEEIARRAAASGCKSIAYTYSEPVVFYEYMFDCAKAGRAAGTRSLMISNGYILERPLRELLEVVDAVKIDLKAFTDGFYRELCSGRLEPVLRTLKILGETGVWFEIVVLLIPSKNDSADEVRSMCRWIVDTLGSSVPVHFTRFHPTYKMQDTVSTPVSTLERAYEIARGEGLDFAYVGNVPGHPAESTRCPGCGKTVVKRTGFWVTDLKIESGRCAHCGEVVPGVWE